MGCMTALYGTRLTYSSEQYEVNLLICMACLDYFQRFITGVDFTGLLKHITVWCRLGSCTSFLWVLYLLFILHWYLSVLLVLLSNPQHIDMHCIYMFITRNIWNNEWNKPDSGHTRTQLRVRSKDYCLECAARWCVTVWNCSQFQETFKNTSIQQTVTPSPAPLNAQTMALYKY